MDNANDRKGEREITIIFLYRIEMKFKILKKAKNSRARLGLIETEHGVIETPAFVPVGTQAAIKGLTVDQLKSIGAQSVLCNTYHLYLRPGDEVVKKMGGLHKFMNWDRPIWTDSGGFQVFSLGYALEHGVGKVANIFPGEETGVLKREGEAEHAIPKKDRLTKITEDGVEFRSHLDGSKHFLTPEKSMEIQKNLGADLIFAFDECTSPLHDYNYTKVSMKRTHRWAVRSREALKNKKQALYGIIQGGLFKDLREESAKFISNLDFEGIGIGGAMGKTKKDMYEILDWIAPILPEEKPRHLLGIGSPEDIPKLVEKGVDTFDCVAPTRLARNGAVLIEGSPSREATADRRSPLYKATADRSGRLDLRLLKNLQDKNPIDKKCDCSTCQNYSRAYLCHLFRANEMLGPILATIHNLYFMETLMKKIRHELVMRV